MVIAPKKLPVPKKYKKLKCGMPVRHVKYGFGVVIGEWGSMRVSSDKEFVCSCADIYDARFTNSSGTPFLHCCHVRFLEVL